MNTIHEPTTSSPEVADACRDNDTERIAALFDAMGEAVIDFQDSPQFVNYLKRQHIPYDDTLEEYWAAVDLLAGSYATQPELGFDAEQKAVFRLVAGAPNALIKEFVLHDDAEAYKSTRQHVIDKATSDQYKNVVSRSNTRIRDYIGEHPNVDQQSFTALLAEAANRGIDPQFWQEGGSLTAITVHGVRTELGFEQKLTAAGIDYRRGTTAEDAIGIDYVAGGVPIDVKSSLHMLLAEAPAGHAASYYAKRGKFIYFPYDSDNDYEDGTFVVGESAARVKSAQITQDIHAMRKLL